ncbi:MAG: hypothetical protein C0483_21175 [Pirellula sp.]|nr:hypothetical protein [Pirellula sp.]
MTLRLSIRALLIVCSLATLPDLLILGADAPRSTVPDAKPAAKPNAGDKPDAAEKANDKDKPGSNPLADDLEAMQGTWVREFANPAGVRMRVEKKVEGEADVVTEYDAQGNIVHAHTSTFELAQHGPLRTFVIRNTLVTAGPNMGARRAGGAFLYRIEGNHMIEAWGLLEADRGAPTMFVWQKQAAAK